MRKKLCGWIQNLKNNELLLDGANVMLGFVLIITLLVYFMSGAYFALLLAVWAAGFMNIVNGLKTMRKKSHTTLGQSMLLMGVIILIGGSFLILSLIQAAGMH